MKNNHAETVFFFSEDSNKDEQEALKDEILYDENFDNDDNKQIVSANGFE